MIKSESSNFIFSNGHFIDAPLAADPINQYSTLGYAAYEGIRAYNTHNGARLFKSKEHILRLQRSCDALGIVHSFNVYDLIDKTYELLEKNVRILINHDSSVVITAHEWNYFLANRPLRLSVSQYERPNPKSIPVEAKIAGHSVYSALASKAAKANGFDEALLLDMDGNVAQSSTANIFIEKNSKLSTPSLGHIFPGITRAVVFDICKKLKITIIEKEISMKELLEADSAFLCGTRTEITGVASIDAFTFPEKWDNTIGSTIQRIFINRVLEQENYEVII